MTAVLGLALLVLLPGLLVVRAPWAAVPALSLAFWALSAWWSPSNLSRSGFVAAAFVAFLVLLVLRLLPRHEVPPPPGWTGEPTAEPRATRVAPALAASPGLLMAAVALALLAPAPLWRNPPGPRLAFQATAARLVLWRDGVPLSSEPLLPLVAFGAHAPAIATLSADVSRVCGLTPARAVLVVLLLGVSLALLGLFSLFGTRLAPAVAARAALLTSAMVAVPLVLGPSRLAAVGAGEAIVALGFLLPSSALLVAHRSRSSALAAAWLAAAGALVQPGLAAASLAGCAPFAARRRWAAVLLGALALAAPGLVPLASALSLAEARQIFRPLGATELLVPACAVLYAAAAAALAVRLARAARTRPARVALVLLAALALLGCVHAWVASAQLPEDAWRTLRRIEQTTGPLEVVCAGPSLRDWVPAIAGRATGEPGPWIPTVYRDEWQGRARRACRDPR